ncbi:response regulator transcription factor [bacterium]|nr:response regulator transcription factor [bacterium]
MKDQKITVCLADDHAILREGLESLIKQAQDIEVIGEASDGHETIKLVEEKQPDILILDIAMPKLNGIEVSNRIKKKFPKTKIIILSMYDNKEYIFELFSCGVSGYLPKESVASDLISAIRAVHKGDFYMSSSISKKVVDGFLQMGQGKKIKKPSSKDNLTSKEKEILQLIAEGYSSREIAGLLNTSMKTVDTHRNNIMKKLNLHRKSELIKYAIQQGIIQINANIVH